MDRHQLYRLIGEESSFERVMDSFSAFLDALSLSSVRSMRTEPRPDQGRQDHL
jgi:hypothetical protein